MASSFFLNLQGSDEKLARFYPGFLMIRYSWESWTSCSDPVVHRILHKFHVE